MGMFAIAAGHQLECNEDSQNPTYAYKGKLSLSTWDVEKGLSLPQSPLLSARKQHIKYITKEKEEFVFSTSSSLLLC